MKDHMIELLKQQRDEANNRLVQLIAAAQLKIEEQQKAIDELKTHKENVKEIIQKRDSDA
jgi:uncharacterized coiled-coil DUF342 family protein